MTPQQMRPLIQCKFKIKIVPNKASDKHKAEAMMDLLQWQIEKIKKEANKEHD